jgi:hypothetical protein
MIAYKIQTPEEVLAWAQQSNWLLIWANEDYSTCAFVATGGNIVEFHFDRNKATVRTLQVANCLAQPFYPHRQFKPAADRCATDLRISWRSNSVCMEFPKRA